MLEASVFLLWVVVALLVVAVIALARQIAALKEQGAPTRTAGESGPGPGDLAPTMSAQTLEGRLTTIGGTAGDGRGALLLFVAPDCSASRKIIPLAMIVARAEDMRLTLIGDATSAALSAMNIHHKLDGYDFINSAQIPLTYRVAKFPAAVLLRADGTIAARGPVLNREQLESLLVLV